MVAGKWNWDIAFMMSAFGWKAAIAVVLNAVGATLLFRRELGQLSTSDSSEDSNSVPLVLVLVHWRFLQVSWCSLIIQ